MTGFDCELVQYTALDEGWSGKLTIDLYKVGGGEVDRSYVGTWGYRVTRDGYLCGEGEDFETGAPCTHAEVATMLSELFDEPDYAA